MMNKRKFFKTILSIFGIICFSPFFLNKKKLNNKIVIKNKFSKVWFLHIDDFK